MKKISLSDVASSLGVSKALVSMVLNNRGNEMGISAETQKRVLAKVKELNYRPNQFARGLRLGKSNTIGLIVADISNPFYSRIARNIEDNCSKHGYNLMICSSDENEEKETSLMHMLLERQVDGLIISTTQSTSKDVAFLKEDNFPFVLIDRFFPNIDSNYVVIDNYYGAFTATEHLINMGYTRIAQMTISPSHLSSLKERSRGYTDALKKHGIKVNKNLTSLIPFGDIKKNVYEHLKFLLSAPQNTQALFLANNNLTVACLECINEMKLRIPHDIAIVSFDDIDLFRVFYPPITAVSQPIDEICKRSVEILLSEINDKENITEKTKEVMQTKLIVRDSCGKFFRNL